MSRIKRAVKRTLVAVAPGVAGPLLRYTAARHVAKLGERLGLPAVNRRVAELTGRRVAAGPFAGLTYIGSATGSTYGPKLVGSYEREIHAWIDRAVRVGYAQFVDVGCAEGYYAVGFACRSLTTSVSAFDTDPTARRLTAELASANGVADRVAIRGECRPDTFTTLGPGRMLVLCDCEGFEADLLVPDVAARLRSADLLVELHEQQRPGVTQMLIDRFAASHRVESVSLSTRDPADYPVLSGLATDAERRLAVNELRGSDQQWLMLTALDPGAGT